MFSFVHQAHADSISRVTAGSF